MSTTNLGVDPTRLDLSYKIGPRVYHPRSDHNKWAWSAIMYVFEHSNSGVVPRGDLCCVLAQNQEVPDQNHYDFLDYLVRRNSLVVITPPE